tara:strand:+ start:462 stop:635 length:174 start_codon:yes stop_codon:yes gene_type:complete
MIRVNSMVRLTIGEQEWIGQVVEIRDEVALVMLVDNMHYHADISELTLLLPPRENKK